MHFAWTKGNPLNSGRYRINKLLGDGTFGRVLLAEDTQSQERSSSSREVGIKVIRDVKRYMENAKIEADILKDIRRADSKGNSRCCLMSDVFVHQEKYFCMVFEALGPSLYEFVKANNFRGFWMQDIHSFTKQLLEGLSFLHDRLNMTHTDLKPENILLATRVAAEPSDFPREGLALGGKRSPKSSRNSSYLRPISSEIKLIDFGNATYADEHHSSIINTRQYRGPEVILSLGWDERSDLWSVGCILMELYTGELLFATHENLEHMALMERCLGTLPPSMLGAASSQVKEQYLRHTGQGSDWRLNWPEGASSSSSERHVRQMRTLREHCSSHHAAFADFCGELLRPLSSQRPRASEALRHSFLDLHFDD